MERPSSFLPSIPVPDAAQVDQRERQSGSNLAAIGSMLSLSIGQRRLKLKQRRISWLLQFRL